jgi:hypothetical protein
MKETEKRDPYTEQADNADDAVIGVAFRRSLLVIAILAALAGAFLWWSRRPVEEAPEKAIQREAPRTVVAEAKAPAARFTEIAREAGIDFVHFNGAEGEKLLPETMGSGAAFFDFDNDQDQDLLLVNSTYWPHGRSVDPPPTARLYANDGRGRFRDVSEEAGLAVELYGTGVAVGDYDGDGWSDVLLTAVGRNRLFSNRRGRFEEVSEDAGIGGDPEQWSSSAAFFDYDGDGDLDLFVANYVRWSREIDFEIDYRLTGVGRAYGPPFNYEGTFPYLYRNNGDGTFADVSAESGVEVRNQATGVPVAKTLGVLPVDVDEDGWVDLFLANDTVRNFLFHNRGDGTFEEVGEFWGIAYGRNGEATGAMGVDAAYYRNNSELGFAVGNFSNEMTSLYLSQGDPTLYADEAIGEGVGAPSRMALSFGVIFLDYDLDGRLDILQTNGHLESEINAVDPSQTYAQPAQLFWNAGPDQRTGFLNVATEELGDLGQPIVGRGSAFADIDGDGDLDLVLTQVGRRPLLLRNDSSSSNHWLRVKLLGRPPNREAIGARLELTAGGITQKRVVMPARGYQSHSELPGTFGLGKADSVDSLVVVWPDGTRQEVEVEVIDGSMTVEYR